MRETSIDPRLPELKVYSELCQDKAESMKPENVDQAPVGPHRRENGSGHRRRPLVYRGTVQEMCSYVIMNKEVIVALFCVLFLQCVVTLKGCSVLTPTTRSCPSSLAGLQNN